MRITQESANQPDVLQLIEELDAYQKPLYPAESHHGIDVEALVQPNVVFMVARDEAGNAVGCGAIVLAGEYGEVKRMYVSPVCRGQGIARALLSALEAQARARGCARFALETGYLQPEAISLYEKAGYVRCGPFASYVDDPNSVFMRKTV